LAFYPIGTIEKALEAGQILHCVENDEPAGYLWHGSIRPGFDITIYQACVDYSARRRHLGWQMVRDLMELGKASGALGIRLRCASSSESNEFWRLIGFYCTRVSQGGVVRGRQLNHWRSDITASLFTVEAVKPSTKSIDKTAYNKMKRDGLIMPSRFSRKHY
tara:strand:+ start:2173 stop:2658 length:486 start_codon:yes stop_codon:yes gene_type:complete